MRTFKNLYHLVHAILANWWYGFPGRKLTVIGVTGTDGKTTTATLIYEILKAAGKKVSMITTVHAVIAEKMYDTGFHVTNPDSWSLQKYLRKAVDAGDEYMVLEVTSHGISQHRIWGIPFEVAVITNITHEHLDWHKTFEEYAATKLGFVKTAKYAILNKKDATYSFPNVSYFENTHYIKTLLPGDYNQENIHAALAVCKIFGVEKQIALKTIEQFKAVVGRMEVIQEKPFRVIVDFAHTPNALHQVLSTIKKTTKGKLIHVFGCAGLRDHTKRPLMGKESEKYANITILTEEDTRTENIQMIWNEITNRKVKTIENRRDALLYAVSIANSGDTVIVTGKGHEKSLCRGTTEYPWSDQETIREQLKEMKYA